MVPDGCNEDLSGRKHEQSNHQDLASVVLPETTVTLANKMAETTE